MFIRLELWEEENREDGKVPSFGRAVDSRLDMKALRYRILPVNVNSITSFEDVRIWTNGRPGTSDNREDTLQGVRVLFPDGSTRVVINDKDPTFLNLLETAKRSSSLVVDGGRSAYLQQFLPRG